MLGSQGVPGIAPVWREISLLRQDRQILINLEQKEKNHHQRRYKIRSLSIAFVSKFFIPTAVISHHPETSTNETFTDY